MSHADAIRNAYEMLREADWQQLESLWPFWLFLGLVVGTFCASPFKHLARMLSYSCVSRFLMAFHGALFIQSLWMRYTSPGTFRRFLRSLHRFVRGEGWDRIEPAKAKEEAAAVEGDKAASWYVTEDDLNFFRRRVEQKEPINASKWETIVEKNLPGELQYIAQRRTLRDTGKTEYLSVSVTKDKGPHEVMDFYLNDAERQNWDNLLTVAEELENGTFGNREQVVHWLRSFPFAFLSDRDYVIARRRFEVDGVLYGISKVIRYPSHDPGNTVQMQNYWSMWSCKAVPCPFGTDKPCTETTLLHMEDFQIPEHLGRFAVKCGMWGFVKKMTPVMDKFVETRRAKGISPFEDDPEAFGSARAAAPSEPGMSGMKASESNASISSDNGGRIKKVASAVFATGMIVVLSGVGSRAIEDRKQQRGRGQKRKGLDHSFSVPNLWSSKQD